MWKREKSHKHVGKLFASHGMPQSLHAEVSILVFLYKGQPLAVTLLLMHPQGCKKNVVLHVVKVDNCFAFFFQCSLSIFHLDFPPEAEKVTWDFMNI